MTKSTISLDKTLAKINPFECLLTYYLLLQMTIEARKVHDTCSISSGSFPASRAGCNAACSSNHSSEILENSINQLL